MRAGTDDGTGTRLWSMVSRLSRWGPDVSVLIVADRDGDPQVALPRGLGLAKAMGWNAEVAAFCYEPIADLEAAVQAEAKRRVTAQCRKSLHARIKEHELQGVDVKTTVAWAKSLAEWVNSRVRRSNVDVVVKTGHRSETFLYTPTDWQLLRECPAPVLIAADHVWHPMRSVVAAVDLGSVSSAKKHLNDAVIRTAKDYANALKYPLHVIHVIHMSRVLKDLEIIDTRAHVAKVRRRLQPEIADLARRHTIPVKSIRTRAGEVHRVVPSMAARLQAQLVVMGTVGRRGVTARLMGNTAERVLARLGADVLALKPGAPSA